MSDLLVFFRGVESSQLADPGQQLTQVLVFRKKLEEDKQHLYEVFDELDDFKQRLRKHMANWVLRHEQDQPLGTSVPEPTQLPLTFTVDIVAAESPEPEDVSATRPELDEAERLADQGQLTEAETDFARSIVGEPDPDAFNRYGHFLLRVGRLSKAETMYERVLELAESSGDELWKANAYGNLGLIYQKRGEFERAGEMLCQALLIFESLAGTKGMATAHCALGWNFQKQNDLERARAAWWQARDRYSGMDDLGMVEKVEAWIRRPAALW